MNDDSTERMIMSLDDVIRYLVYRPYGDELSVMIDRDDRVHIKTDHWLVILDHKSKRNDFFFTGELHKYYEVDTIESIRDCFGDIYSVVNRCRDELVYDTWFIIDGGYPILDECARLASEIEVMRKSLYQKRYYLEHKKELSAKYNEYYKIKKESNKK